MSSKKPKVVQLSSVHTTFDTRIFHKICKSLKQNGYDVDLIIQNEKNEVKDGINIIALPKTDSKVERLLRVLPALLAKSIKYPPNTIFHFHDPEILPVAFLLKFFGYKIIYDVHEDVPKSILSKNWVPHILKKTAIQIVSWLEKKATRYFDGIVVVAENVRERLDSSKTIMVQNFPILSNYTGTDVTYNPEGHLFYIGDITTIRGAREMIETVARIQKKRKINFLLAGRFSPPELKDEVQRLEGWQYTNFVGWVSRQEFREYMGNAVLGFMLLYPEPNHLRSQPNKLFEYMSGGIPVISSNLPRYSEIINRHRCGLLVDPKNVNEVTKAVEWVLDHPKEASEMGKRGREAVFKYYNWENQEKILLKWYQVLSTSW